MYQNRRKRIRYVNIFFIIVVCSSVLLFWHDYVIEDVIEESVVAENSVAYEFYEKRKFWNTSILGSILYKNLNNPVLSEDSDKIKFTILIWKRWEHLKKRHIYYFGSTRHDPLEDCSVRNCFFTGDDNLLNTADAVLVHLHTGLIPETDNRNPKQKWIFLDDESPKNSFALAKRRPALSELANIFNWSMTFRSDSDIPVPYGRTVALQFPKFPNKSTTEIVPNWKIKRRDVLASILISNCGIPYRMKLIKDLKKLMKIDVHGICGDGELKNSCPGHFRADCEVMSQYLFYIVLENSKCKEYFTEKLFYNAYFRGAIPIIQGPSIEDCEKLLPPNSYLHFDNYATLAALVQDVVNISENEERLLSFHLWRNKFEVRNEHGYFGSKSYHLCRLCEAMNYNDMKHSVYTEDLLERFLDYKSLCRP